MNRGEKPQRQNTELTSTVLAKQHQYGRACPTLPLGGQQPSPWLQTTLQPYVAWSH